VLDRTDGVGSASARQGRTEYSRRGSAVKQGHAELDGDGRSRSDISSVTLAALPSAPASPSTRTTTRRAPR